MFLFILPSCQLTQRDLLFLQVAWTIVYKRGISAEQQRSRGQNRNRVSAASEKDPANALKSFNGDLLEAMAQHIQNIQAAAESLKYIRTKSMHWFLRPLTVETCKRSLCFQSQVMCAVLSSCLRTLGGFYWQRRQKQQQKRPAVFVRRQWAGPQKGRQALKMYIHVPISALVGFAPPELQKADPSQMMFWPRPGNSSICQYRVSA